MRRILTSWWLQLLLRLLVGGIFIFSGAVKLSDPKGFAALISKYGLVPDDLLVVVAIGLPLVELLAGLGTLFNIRGSLETIMTMLVFFIAILWFGLLHDLDVDCGCFSVKEQGEQQSLRTAFVRDWALVAVTSYLIFCRRLKINSPGFLPATNLTEEK